MTRVIIYLCIFAIYLVLLKHYLNYKRRPRWVIVDMDDNQFEHFGEQPTPPQSKVAIACLMRKPVDLPEWLDHHRQLGISHFFIRLEDTREQEDYLKAQKDVSLTIAQSDKSGNNYETLQTRQIEYVNKSINDAKEMKIDWMFHIDADELLHGSLVFLDTLDQKYKNVWMENVEAIFNLDKKDKDSRNDTCFSAKKFLRCSNGAPCRSYINGKAGGRVVDDVGLKGPHNFHYKGQHTGDHVFNIPFKTLHVLHFDSCSFSAWVEKFHHLGKKNGDKIPFTYYNESINAVEKAFDTYKKFLSPSTKDISKDQIYTLTESDL